MAEVQNGSQFAPLKKMIAANGDILAGEQEGGDNNFSGLVESFLTYVEKNGTPQEFTWADVKSVIIAKFDEVAKKYEAERSIASLPAVPNVDNYTFDEYRTRIVDRLNGFDDAPFTLNRICELLRDPRKHYDRGDKFLRAFEKCVTVTSTNGGSDSTTNGSTNGHTENGHTNGDSHMETDSQTTSETAETNGHHATNGASDSTTGNDDSSAATTTTTEADSTVTVSDEKMTEDATPAATENTTAAADTTATSETVSAAPFVEESAATTDGMASTVAESTTTMDGDEKESLKRPNEDDEPDSVGKKIARLENGSATHAVVGEPEVEPHVEVEQKKDTAEIPVIADEEMKSADGVTAQEAAV